MASSPLRCFLIAFFKFLFTCSVSCFCLVASLCFRCFWCVQNLFVRKKKKDFKTDLITSFTLLLKFSLLQAWIFLINLFQWSESFSVIRIFLNYYNLVNYYNYVNYHNLFQSSHSSLSESFLSQSFSVSLQLVTLSLSKIRQHTNYIIQHISFIVKTQQRYVLNFICS